MGWGESVSDRDRAGLQKQLTLCAELAGRPRATNWPSTEE